MTPNEHAARQILAGLAGHLAAYARDPSADVETMCRQAEQNAGLARAELAASSTVTQHADERKAVQPCGH